MRYEAAWYFNEGTVVIFQDDPEKRVTLKTLHTKEQVHDLGEASTWIESLGYRLASDWTFDRGGVPCRYVPLQPKED